MPPFKYEAFVNPYIGSISELMGKGDQAKAEALLRIGEIQARAEEQRGQAWGNAVQGLGNIASKAITDYNDPKAREARAIDKAQKILDVRSKELVTGQGQRLIAGTLQPGSTSQEFVVPESRGIGADVFGRTNFGAGSRPNVTTDKTFALAQADPNGQTIDNALPNEGLRNALSRSNAFGPTERLPGSTSSVAQAGMQPNQRASSFGRMEERITPPRMSAPQVETYDKAPRNRYTTAQGLYDVRLAYDDLVKAGVSTKIAIALAGQGQQANSIFSAYDADKKALDEKRIAVRGSIANMAIKLMDTGMSAQDALTQASGPAGNRLSQDDMNAFAVQLNNQPTEQDKRALFLSEVKAWDDQGVSQVVNPGDYVVNKNSGTGTQYGTRPVADPSAASKTLAIAQADFARGIENGSIPLGTSFTDWSKKITPAVPASIQEYKYAAEQGYKGTYNEYQTLDANRRRSLTINNAATDDAMIAQAAQSIVDNPRDLTSPRTISSLRGDQRMKLFNEIKRISPDFNVGNIERQIKFLDSYENPAGRAAINRSSMNNILMHSADLSVVNETYRRSDLRLVNTAISEIAKQGGTTWSQFMTPLQVLKEEIALYFAGGYAPKGQQQATWEQIVNDKATPSQVEQFAKDIIHVGLRRADTANEQFKTMMGYDDPNLITPEAVLAAQKLGLGNEVKKYGSGGQIGARGETKEQRATRIYNSLTGGN